MIREFQINDIDKVMEIWLASNLDAHSFVEADYWISNVAFVREQLLQAEIYVFEEQNKILGFVGVQENYLAGIFIDKAFRSLGIGKQLLDYIKNGHNIISLNVYKENRNAVKFYMREGFTIISEELDDATDCIEYLMQWDAEKAIDSKATNDQYSQDDSKDKKVIMSWIKTHKKQLILVGISIPTLTAIVLGIKNKESIKKLLDNLMDEIEKSYLYSSDWFKKATDAELNVAREKVRLDYCASGDDFKAACSLQNLLRRFDEELSKRAWGDEIPHAPNIHREHGWYLPNDD